MHISIKGKSTRGREGGKAAEHAEGAAGGRTALWSDGCAEQRLGGEEPAGPGGGLQVGGRAHAKALRLCSGWRRAQRVILRSPQFGAKMMA